MDLAGSEKISMHDPIKSRKRDVSAGKNIIPLKVFLKKNIIGAATSLAPPNVTSLFKERVNESKHINKSLFFLTQVISLKS